VLTGDGASQALISSETPAMSLPLDCGAGEGLLPTLLVEVAATMATGDVLCSDVLKPEGAASRSDCALRVG